MLIVHTSDWHLGRTLHGVDMSDDTQHFLRWLCDLVRTRHVDVVLVSGDVHDRSIASLAGITQLSVALEDLCEHATVILTSGNHDSALRLGANAGLYRSNLVVATDASQVGTAVEVSAADGVQAVVYPIPYLDPDQTRDILSDQTDADGQPVSLKRSHVAVMGAALRRVRADLSRRRRDGFSGAAVAMVHAFVSGAQTTDSEYDISVGGVQAVPANLFDTLGSDAESGQPKQDLANRGLDYVALGHLHRGQNISGAHVPIRYSGSPVPYSFSEAGHHKSVTLLTATQRGVTDIEVVPIPQIHHLRVLTGTLSDVVATPGNPNDWLSITLTDEHLPLNSRAVLQRHYPHVLTTAETPRGAPASLAPAVDRTRPISDLIAQFFTDAGGRELTQEEQLALTTVVEQAQKEELS